MDHELRDELYLSFLLLGADAMLLGTLDNADAKDLLADLRNWNEAKLLEMKEWLPSMSGSRLEAVEERIRQYEAIKKAA
jgi:CHASE3 domain sensor protein